LVCIAGWQAKELVFVLDEAVTGLYRARIVFDEIWSNTNYYQVYHFTRFGLEYKICQSVRLDTVKRSLEAV
jgi:hypothetical protein